MADGMAETRDIEITRHRLPTPGLASPVRVVQLTDLHRSWCVSEPYLATVIDKANRLSPDIAVLTGDYVTRSSSYITSCASQIARLRAPLGCYGILGNHDYWCDHGRGAPAVSQALRRVGVHVITNENIELANGLFLAGVDDCVAGTPNIRQAFAGIPESAARLAITHNPDIFFSLRKHRCVTLAGHLHGGQIYIRGFTEEILGYSGRSMRGWWADVGYPGRLYVCRGIGVVSPPLRINSRPELAVFDLVPA